MSHTPERDMQIIIRGELEGFLAGWQERLGALVHGHLQGAPLPIERVEVVVSRTESGEFSCSLAAAFSIPCELVAKETGVFLANPAELACLRVRAALAEIDRLSSAGASRVGEAAIARTPDA